MSLTASAADSFFGFNLLITLMPCSNSWTATSLSNGVLLISPQSVTVAQFRNGLTPWSILFEISIIASLATWHTPILPRLRFYELLAGHHWAQILLQVYRILLDRKGGRQCLYRKSHCSPNWYILWNRGERKCRSHQKHFRPRTLDFDMLVVESQDRIGNTI